MSKGVDLPTLRKWGEAFNRFLITSGKFTDEEGKTVRQENEWTSHFSNWLNLQIGKDINKLDNKANSTPSTLSIDEQIKNEPDKEKRNKLLKEKYSQKPTKIK